MKRVAAELPPRQSYRKNISTMYSPSAANGSNTIMAARAFNIAWRLVERIIMANSTRGICAGPL